MEITACALEPGPILALRPERRHGTLPHPLYVAGSLDGLAAPTVAIVGTRSPSDRGRQLARDLAQELGLAGICIISGLARGIDAAAHEGALAAGAPTIGVLAGGHARLYPREHAALAQRLIAQGGAVVSAYAATETPYPSRFLARNGLIVTLADAVVVVEAPQRSGALNTASWAADANIPVLAIPGDVDRVKIAGCLELIRDGATLARHAADVLEALGLHRAATKPGPPAKRPDPRPTLFGGLDLDRDCSAPEITAIRQALESGPASCDDLSLLTKLPIAVVVRTLHILALYDIVHEGEDGRYFQIASART